MSPIPRITQRSLALVAAALIGLVGTILVPTVAAANSCGTEKTAGLQDKQWELARLRPETAWPLSKGAGQIVAVVDSGVSVQHPQLANQVYAGKDFVGNDPHCDRSNHGTLIAGIIAGEYRDNDLFYGLAPEAKILPVRIAIDDETFARDPQSATHVAKGIKYAVDKGASVINLSVRTDDTGEMKEAVQYARDHNVVLVAAAGNVDGQHLHAGDLVYPAAYDGVIAVGSIDRNGAHVATSNPASFVDVAAPGDSITGPSPRGGGYGTPDGGGTSFATGFVSGTVALVRAYYKNLTADQAIERVLATADAPPGGWSPQLGYGVVNPYEAVASLNGKLPQATSANEGLAVTQPHAPVDPLKGIKIAASLSAVAAIALTIIILVAQAVRRHVRKRDTATNKRTPGKALTSG